MVAGERADDVAFADGTGAAAGCEPGCTGEGERGLALVHGSGLSRKEIEEGKRKLTCIPRETRDRKANS